LPVLQKLEQYTIIPCENWKEKPGSSFRLETGFFDSDVRYKLRQILEDELTYKRIQSVSSENNVMSITFYPGKDGRAEKISLNSPWGIQFYNAIENALRTHIRVLSYQGPVYFRLNIRFEGSGIYRYNYSFSENASNKN
jgi:hypothetical protein